MSEAKVDAFLSGAGGGGLGSFIAVILVIFCMPCIYLYFICISASPGFLKTGGLDGIGLMTSGESRQATG